MKELFEEYLKSVEFNDYSLFVTCRSGVLYLQASWMEVCSVYGHQKTQYSRQWMLHPNMTKSEVIQTAFKLCLTAAEHEVREAFKYKGARIFGPHFDVEALVGICDDQRLDYRKVA